MKIPFDIKFRPQIESGEYKVETREGSPVRIICWDRLAKKHNNNSDLSLCVLIPDDGGEAVYYYDRSGKRWVPNEDFDLFIITPEPELSEFEKALKDCVNARNPENPMTDEGARNNATILLAIARKELEPEIKAEALKEIEQDPESSYAFKRGVEYGKEEALKDLPRWKKAASSYGNYTVALTETGQMCLLIDGYYIMLSDLEKLPGFNE